MSDYGGFLFNISEPERAFRLDEIAQEMGTFTDTISSSDWKPKALELCLLSFDGRTFTYAALARRGRKVATLKYGVRFFDLVELGELPFARLKREIGSKFKAHFKRASGGIGGRVGPRTWEALIASVKRLRPGVATHLDRLEMKRMREQRAFNIRAPQLMAMEKDAVALALGLFGIERAQILETWDPSERGSSAPFITGLPEYRLQEDAIIFHDVHRFGDWSQLRKHVTGAVEFVRDNEKLTVLNVNRTSVEKALGVDLLYYHHRYGSFVLVQYKRMEKEEWSPDLGFRPRGKQYDEELARMRRFRSEHLDAAAIDFENYRLNAEAFYLKLCPSIAFKPWEMGLLKGMYWPLDGWDLLVSSPRVQGEKGGVRITYRNVERYVGNDLFIRLVQDGWVGSRGLVSEAIEYVVKAVLAGRSVTVALSEATGRSNAGSRLDDPGTMINRDIRYRLGQEGSG